MSDHEPVTEPQLNYWRRLQERYEANRAKWRERWDRVSSDPEPETEAAPAQPGQPEQTPRPPRARGAIHDKRQGRLDI